MDKNVLNRDARSFAKQAKTDVERKFKGTHPRKNDYPAAAVVCAGCRSKDGRDHLSKDVSGDPNIVKWDNSLLSAINSKLGRLGEISKFTKCKNKVGRCAEPHAANKVFRNGYAKCLVDLMFSVAVRPRTGFDLPYCDNCKTLFNL